MQRLSTTLHDFCSLLLAERRSMLFVYIPMLLQGAALVAVRHFRVTNFPFGVRTATRAAPCDRHGSGVGVVGVISSASWRVVTVPRLTALPYHLPLMTLSFRWH